MWSGYAELACGVGLLLPPTRRLAGLASAGLLLAVWPANAQMTIDAARVAREKGTPTAWAAFAGTLARLPGQLPLVRATWRTARGEKD